MTTNNQINAPIPFALSKGGTAASLTADNGAIVYSNATTLALLASTSTAGQIVRSGSSAAPTWSTATYPATTTVSQLLYSSSTNVIAGLASANSSVLTTDGSGIPTWVAKTGVIGSVIASRITATGAFTYTPTTGMRYVRVRMNAGSGGGGGATGLAAKTAAAGGGCVGGFLEFYMTAAQVGASLSGSIGAGGAGGTGSNTGTAGGNTTFGDWTAAGGKGGIGCIANTTSQLISGGASTANTTGTGTLLTNLGSTLGFSGYTVGITLAVSGAGTASQLGIFTANNVLVATASNAGFSGTGRSGGSGGCTFTNVGVDAAGGAGTDGIIILEEFVSV